MNSDIQTHTRPTSLTGLRFACPKCRADLDVAGAAACSACGFQPRLIQGVYSLVEQGRSVDDWQHVFDELAAGENGDTSAANEYRSRLQQDYMIAAFRRLCGAVPRDARILEIGCGNGMFWQNFLGGQPAVAIDYSVPMCVRAAARGMTTFHAEASALPFAADQFDLVYSAEVLQYITDLPGFYRELARVCRPGGRILLSTLNKSSLLRDAMRLYRKIRPHPVGAPPGTMVMRTCADMESAIGDLPLSLDRVCWTHFPLPWQRETSRARTPLDPFATNFVVHLTKTSG